MAHGGTAYLSSDYSETLLKYCRNCGIDATALLPGDEQARDYLSSEVIVKLLAEMSAQLKATPYQIGLFIGISCAPSSHGQVGFVGLCSEHFHQALELSSRFLPIVTPCFELDYTLSSELAIIELSTIDDLPAACEEFFIGLILGGLRAMALALLGDRLFHYLDRSLIQLTVDEEQLDARWRDAMGPLRFEYGQAHNKISFARELVLLPLPSANKAGLASAIQACEDRLDKLEKRRARESGTMLEKVRLFLNESEHGYPSLEETAKHFFVSSRTLNRQLQAQQTSYSELVKLSKIDRAKTLLRHSSTPIKTIALELGYTDTSSFSSAFRRAAGVSPRQFRTDSSDDT